MLSRIAVLKNFNLQEKACHGVFGIKHCIISVSSHLLYRVFVIKNEVFIESYQQSRKCNSQENLI